MSANVAPEVGVLMVHIIDRTISYLAEEAGLLDSRVAESDTPEPKAIAASLPIRGALVGSITLSASEETIAAIMRQILGGEVPPGEEMALLQDTLPEILNIIVGNTTQTLDEAGLRICVHPPERRLCAGGTAFGGQRPFPVFRREILTTNGPLEVSFSDGGEDAAITAPVQEQGGY